MLKTFETGAIQHWERFLSNDEELFTIQQIHLPMTEYGLWALQVPRQLLNIANIQSRSWSRAEFVQVAKHLWCLWNMALKSIK
ncbi:hypothetical protein TNCV_2772591 [Trichonephila clavipes]|nr:hypothetical protein TNCV_2772591 [Trichonephila clavipes]